MGKGASTQKARTGSAARVRLSERQRYWLEHLRACEDSGESMKGYAKHHGLSVYGLYAARKRLRPQAPSSSNRQRTRVSFVKAESPAHPNRGHGWRVRFPNGAILEGDTPLEGERLDFFLQSLARL